MAWTKTPLGNKGRWLYLEIGVGLDADWESDPIDIRGARACWVGMSNRTAGSMTATGVQLEAQWNRAWTGADIWGDALYQTRGAGSPSDTALDIDGGGAGLDAAVWYDGTGDSAMGNLLPFPQLRLVTEATNAADTAFSADFWVIVQE